MVDGKAINDDVQVIPSQQAKKSPAGGSNDDVQEIIDDDLVTDTSAPTGTLQQKLSNNNISKKVPGTYIAIFDFANRNDNFCGQYNILLY